MIGLLVDYIIENGESFRTPHSGLLCCLIDSDLDFFPMNRNVLRSVDSDTNPVASDLNNRDLDTSRDDDGLVFLP
jgi:hypothetical protein